MVYNQYTSPLQQTPQQNILLPLHQVLDQLNPSKNTSPTHIPEFAPSDPVFIDSFLEQYLHGMIWSVITQTLAGEYAARMTAMDNATKNCDDMIHSLKLEYNQNRQARITNELIEIISGAEALQKG
jgi:F-type H+-transporting ATPase subunit gamma